MLDVISKISKTHSLLRCTECKNEYISNHYTAKKSRIGHLCKLCKSTTGQEINQDLVRKFFNYDPISGKLSRRLATHGGYVGEEVGFLCNNGYLSVGISENSYLVHRIIWLYQKGHFPTQVDHLDHNKLNNSWGNLREVDNTTNSKNCKVSSNSLSKVNGVSFMKNRNKYRAYIMVNKKQIHLGVFATVEEAKLVRDQANIKYNFHSNHGSS